MARLLELYKNEVKPKLKEELEYKNVMEVPQLEKVVINMGIGDAKDNSKILDTAIENLTQIAGQKPVITRSKKAIAGFKIKEGMPIGCKVTLRGERMYHFLDKLINVALPRVRDFKGVSPKSFDGRGNYTMGLKEQMVFPEIEYDDVERVQGMDIIITTTAETDEEAKELLRNLGMPFSN
ncbi:50S ribosomal protein L5 [Natranaerobius trueperi]|uniref:Large ribosomal subunit protein uL5 n=1 Tax=Natranaerobius trueperi TaxID=759412 RepID=A0A226BZK3_9FIRM|nr:50S ribosomal protein L5 [Natranaerobius trueperi]OWZ84478.1 50S ribosomal protein L5 [Natranaerobius trueperi]